MSEKQYDAVVAGHVCLDVIPQFAGDGGKSLSEIFAPGRLTNVGAAAVSTGGPVSNTGLPLIKLGVKTALTGRIGDDFFGQGIRSVFRDWGADGALTVVPGEETSYTIVLAPPNLDRFFLHNPGANDRFCADDIDYDLVARCRLFHLGYPPLMRAMFTDGGRELVRIYRRVKELGVTTSLDMAFPDPGAEAGQVDWDGLLTAVLPYVDIAPFSAEETLFMLNRARFDDLAAAAGQRDLVDVFPADEIAGLARELLARGAAAAPLKCGRRGLLLLTAGPERLAAMGDGAPNNLDRWANRTLWEEVFRVDRVASAVGSGDNTIAGFLAAFLRSCAPEQALATACCVGAQNVQAWDAISGVHTWDETQSMMPGWEKSREHPGPGWTYDDGQRIWRGAADAAGTPDGSRRDK